MIIFIHGFASSGNASKAGILKEYFGQSAVVAPDLSYIPDVAMNQLVELVNSIKDQQLVFVGSSLGGFYALSLLEKFPRAKVVLVNPAMRADRDLKTRVGKNLNYKTGQEFDFLPEYVEELEKIRPNIEIIDPKNVLVLLQTGDNLLDYKEALEMLPNSENLVIEGGSHEFDNFDSMCPVIEKFISGIGAL